MDSWCQSSWLPFSVSRKGRCIENLEVLERCTCRALIEYKESNKNCITTCAIDRVWFDPLSSGFQSPFLLLSLPAHHVFCPSPVLLLCLARGTTWLLSSSGVFRSPVVAGHAGSLWSMTVCCCVRCRRVLTFTITKKLLKQIMFRRKQAAEILNRSSNADSGSCQESWLIPKIVQPPSFIHIFCNYISQTVKPSIRSASDLKSSHGRTRTTNRA